MRTVSGAERMRRSTIGLQPSGLDATQGTLPSILRVRSGSASSVTCSPQTPAGQDHGEIELDTTGWGGAVLQKGKTIYEWSACKNGHSSSFRAECEAMGDALVWLEGNSEPGAPSSGQTH